MTRSRRTKPRTNRTVTSNKAAAGRSWLSRAAVACLAIATGALAGATLALSLWSRSSGAKSTEARLIRLESPIEASTVTQQLAAAGLIDTPWLMTVYLQTLGRFGELEPGEHLLPTNASPRVLAQCLARSAARPTVDVLISEGVNHVQVAQRLERAGISPAGAFIDIVRNRDTLDRHGIRARDGEGYIFPATYRLHVDSNPEKLFLRFLSETRTRLRRIAERIGEEPFQALSARRGWGETEILILASIVEKEARVDAERPLVASVFFNRLDSEEFRPKHMLQSDPTAAYGCVVLGDTIPSCREYEQKVLPAMLRDPSNPYNTYRHPGLPPGAIANPGESAILAVLKPATTDYLFFVAGKEGRHRFSSNFEDHDAKVRNGAE
ncbi:MAG TPA: endolytic transglycosylase MltG [Polyangiaceae bacterium]|nr:endolytic transglycosylase MltG [Polyangiaceae bacterium]